MGKINVVKSNIANALTSAASNHILGVAADIYDEELEQYQSDINKSIKQNVIEIVKVNGTALTPDADKAVDITISDLGLSGALKFAGTLETLPAPTVDDKYVSGDVVLVGNKEYVRINKTETEAGTWEELGDQSSFALKTVTVTGTGALGGGGTLEESRTITHNTSGVTSGSYTKVTVDEYGHVTDGSNPTTLSGYGITDAKIEDGVITLGANTITPLTEHQSLADYATKTEVEAKQDTLTEANAGNGITIANGIISADASSSDITDLQNQINALAMGAKLTLASSKSLVARDVDTFNLTATFNLDTPASVSIFDGATELVKTEDSRTATKTGMGPLSDTKTYTAKAIYLGMNFNASVTVTVKDYILYGFCAGASEFSGLIKYLGSSTKGKEFISTSTADGQDFYLLVPDGIALPTRFSMGKAPAEFEQLSKVVVGGVNYTPFKAKDTYASGATLKIEAE